MSRAVLSLGSNLGDRLARLEAGVRGLATAGTVVAVSPVYETAPVGGPPQPDYLNAVVLLDTALDPDLLLAHCLAVEEAAGRVRSERWGPRVLDVDLVVYDDVVRDDPALTLPHPRAAERAFVLRPWLDVDAAAVLAGVPVADLLSDLLEARPPSPTRDLAAHPRSIRWSA